MFTTDPSGDERIYARELCRHLGLPLTECAYRADDIDIDVAMSPHLPRPIGRTLAQAYERAHLQVAEEIKADAFVTGNGGDNVLGFSQSAAAVTDYYLRYGLGYGLLRTVRDVCRQTESGPMAVVRAALRLRRRGYLWSPGPMFLNAGVLAALAPEHLHQPWLDVPSGVGPGKAAHVASLLRVQPTLEPGRSSFAPVIAPLLSQPVIEACLAIPSWDWRAGGRDRAVARAAFAADLPTNILGRRSKGGPDGFSAIILRQHRSGIRERLLDGMLARNRVIDRAALEARFLDPRPFSGEEQGRLLELVDTEAWANTWSGRVITFNRPAQPSRAPMPPSA
jgi:asparagine synthase (glutamine-hydrolysing)